MREIAKMLVLSTMHLHPRTCNEWLYACPWAAFEKGDYGWFVHVPDVTVSDVFDVPLEMRSALHVARIAGCQWVMFDRDGPVVEDLPTYELSWETEPCHG